MRSDTALLTKEEGGSPIRNPSTAAEDARLASLISLDAILKQVKVSLLLSFSHVYFSYFLYEQSRFVMQKYIMVICLAGNFETNLRKFCYQIKEEINASISG